MADKKTAKAAEPDNDEAEKTEAEEPETAETTGAEEPETVEAPDAEPDAEAPDGRIEVYDRRRPDGTWVTITRNIDTGEQTVVEKD